MRHWQIEEFLRQTGKAENTQHTYRGQLVRSAAWCNKSWLDVTPSDSGKYRRELKSKGVKPTSVNHVLNTLRLFYNWLRRSNGYPMNQPLPTNAIDLEWQPESQGDHQLIGQKYGSKGKIPQFFEPAVRQSMRNT